MDVVIVRHGEAEPAPPQLDEARSLTERGREDIHALGKRLSALLVGRVKILSSPFVRTRETSLILAEELHIEPPEVRRELKPGARPTWVLNRLLEEFESDDGRTLQGKKKSPENRVVIIVGHVPDVVDMVHTLLDEPELDVSFMPGNAVVIHFEDSFPRQGAGKLVHALTALV